MRAYERESEREDGSFVSPRGTCRTRAWSRSSLYYIPVQYIYLYDFRSSSHSTNQISGGYSRLTVLIAEELTCWLNKTLITLAAKKKYIFLLLKDNLR